MDMVSKRSQVSSWLEGGEWGVTEKDQHPLSLAGTKNKQKKREIAHKAGFCQSVMCRYMFYILSVAFFYLIIH